MSKHFLHGVLTILVLTLAASNVLLANEMVSVQSSMPDLALQLNSLSSSLRARVLADQIAPTINILSPNYGPIGTVVTIRGSGFLADNTVKFDFGSIKGVASKDGKTISFVVPATINYDCSTTDPCPTNTWQTVVSRPYSVVVHTASGVSNTAMFTVTTVGNEQVKIENIAPKTGKIGTKVTLSGKGFTSKNNTVIFGSYHRIEGIKSGNQKTIQFTVPRSLIYPCSANQPCPTSTETPVIPEVYLLHVENAKGNSNTIPFTVK